MADRRDKLTSAPTFEELHERLIEDGVDRGQPLPRGLQPATPRGLQLQPTPGPDQMRLGRFHMTPTGLRIEGMVSETEWRGFMQAMKPVIAGLTWVIGDWCAHGEKTWGKTYDAMADLTGLDKDTLRSYASAARNVQLLIRINNLSFAHHRLVAALPGSEQAEKLRHAAANSLSLAEFRAYLKGGERRLPKPLTVARFQDQLVELYTRQRVRPLDERLRMAELLREMALALEQEESTE